MKIAVIDTGSNNAPHHEAQTFLPRLLQGLTERGGEVRLFTKDAPEGDAFDELARSTPLFSRSLWRMDGAPEEDARAAARWLDEFELDAYLIWHGDAAAWAALPLLDPATATLAVGHADSEDYYAPARHYRSFLTRVVGTTPETCVGFVINCVIEKERVEWISYDEIEGSNADSAEEDLQKVLDAYAGCLEKAIADAGAAPRELTADFPPMPATRSPAPSWFDKLKAKIMN